MQTGGNTGIIIINTSAYLHIDRIHRARLYPKIQLLIRLTQIAASGNIPYQQIAALGFSYIGNDSSF